MSFLGKGMLSMSLHLLLPSGKSIVRYSQIAGPGCQRFSAAFYHVESVSFEFRGNDSLFFVHGFPLSSLVDTYFSSLGAFCNWLVVQNSVEISPVNHVRMPKVGKPLIRIIEFDGFECMLKSCAPPHEVGPITDSNAARNRAIFSVLWDTGIRQAELCDLCLVNLDREKG